jgi:hypothetical protein
MLDSGRDGIGRYRRVVLTICRVYSTIDRCGMFVMLNLEAGPMMAIGSG